MPGGCRIPWRIVAPVVVLTIGAALCVFGKDEAGMLVIGSALIGLGLPAAARGVRRK